MEAARKASICVGLLLLIGFIISVIMVYFSGSSRSSYKSTVEETWKQRELRKKEKHNNQASHGHIPATVQEANVLAEELQKLFVKTSNGSRGGANDSARRRKGPKIEISPNSKPLSASNPPLDEVFPRMPNEVLPSDGIGNETTHDGGGTSGSSFRDVGSNLDEEGKEVNVKDAGSKEHHLKATKIIIEQSTSGQSSSTGKLHQNEFYPTHWNPSITPRLQQIAHHQMNNTNFIPGITHQYSQDMPKVVTILKKDVHPTSFSRSELPAGRIPNAQINNLVQRQRGNHPYSLSHPQHFPHPTVKQNWNEEVPEDEDLSLDDYEEQYLLEADERDDDESTAVPTDPLKDMMKLFQVVNNLYKFGPDGTNFNGILKVINDTVQGSNNTGLLSRLNKLYTRPKTSSSPSTTDSVFVGRNAYENSLSAFVFMSFGIFLLKQIHNFAGGGTFGTTQTVKGRSFEDSNLLEESELNILFQQPNGTQSLKINPQDNLDKLENSRKLFNGTVMREINLDSTSNTSVSSDTMNNMFRAALNLVNAYTKSDKGVECIWSMYCRDLDKTAAMQGSMYSMAARINSIGLRLIMGQIPTELTINAMLQSLLGWDGLPCSQMFPKCQVDKGTVKLQIKLPVSSNGTSSQTAKSI